MAFSRRLFLSPPMIEIAADFGGGKDDAKKAEQKADTQVAAKVNSNEITVSRIVNILSGVTNIAPEDAERARRVRHVVPPRETVDPKHSLQRQRRVTTGPTVLRIVRLESRQRRHGAS